MFGAVSTRTRKGPIQRGESSECNGRGVRSASSNTSSPAANCASRREAGPHWVRCGGGGQRAADALAAVGVEGRVAGPEGRRLSR